MQYKKIIFGIILLLFSFYYTDFSIGLIRENDPIMKEIHKNSGKFTKKAVNAKVCGDKIIPGMSGVGVDYKKSYQKMKSYGRYNESLTVFKSLEPSISVDDYYDKYMNEGRDSMDVSLVFMVNNQIDPNNIINILNSKNVEATFFIDGLWLENNTQSINSFKNFEVELLSYDNKYNEAYFQTSLNSLSALTGITPMYCFSEYDNKEVIELCSKLRLHTVLPTLKAGNYLYNDIVSKVRGADIVLVPINTTSEIELGVSIDYLRQKGFKLVTLKKLLSESDEK